VKENLQKDLVRPTTTVAILSSGERFEKLARGASYSGPKVYKKFKNLAELFAFTRDHGVANRLVLDLAYAPEITGYTLRELRALGWDNLILIAPKFDKEQIKKLFVFRVEQIMMMPDGPTRSPLAEKMSERELVIMQMLADGLRIPAIAKELHFSPQTIKRTLEKMLKRLGYTRRIRLLADLFRQGVLK
jgi:DNA-binding CsgD family transcriptional regulator